MPEADSSVLSHWSSSPYSCVHTVQVGCEDLFPITPPINYNIML